MRILAVNTATNDRFVALCNGGVLDVFVPMEEERRQVQDLVPVILGMVPDFSALDGFAIVTGPGSFTGVRIGIAALRGMAMAAKKPLVGMTSFDLYARALGRVDRDILVAVDSRRDELYFQSYDCDLVPAGHPFMFLPETLPRDSGVIVTGDAANVAQAVGELCLTKVTDTALALGLYAAEMIEKGCISAPNPFYVRPPDITLSAKG